MAVNHADGMFFTGVLIYAAAAALAVASAGAVWFAITFAVAGLLAGCLIAYVGRKLVYSIVDCGFRIAAPMKTWAQTLFFTPFFVFYIAFPLLVLSVCVPATFWGAAWLAIELRKCLSGWTEIAAGILSSAASLSLLIVLARKVGYGRARKAG